MGLGLSNEYKEIDGLCIELKEAKAALATAQAQVAVMAEALQFMVESIVVTDEVAQGAYENAQEALSAAPMVVCSGEAQVNMYYDLEWTGDVNEALAGRMHTKVSVIVLDKQSKSVKRRLAVQKGEGK